jgi:hypothetical protein
MKQTAVEWLFNQMSNVAAGYVTELNEQEILNKAKEMEKEQIKDAWFDGVTNWDSEKEVEDYIKETFKSE